MFAVPSPSTHVRSTPFTPRPPVGRERIMISPTAEQIHYSTETFNECGRLVHSGRVQAGIQYLMRRWRAIPEALQTRFLHAEFLTLPSDTHAGINDLLLVRSREAGIADLKADLRHRMREDQERSPRLEALEPNINAT